MRKDFLNISQSGYGGLCWRESLQHLITQSNADIPFTFQQIATLTQQRINRISSSYRRIPACRLFLFQQPKLHFFYQSIVVACLTQSFHYSYMSGYRHHTPSIRIGMESKMSSHFIRLYKVFFYGSYKLIHFRFASCLLQDNGCLRFTDHGTALKITSQLGKEVTECFCIFSGELYRTERYQIHIFHSGIRQNGNLRSVLLCLADSTVLFQSLFVQIVKGLGFHHRCFFRQCLIRKQRKTDKQSGDISRYITVAGHAAEPAPCAILALQFFQFEQGCHITVI